VGLPQATWWTPLRRAGGRVGYAGAVLERAQMLRRQNETACAARVVSGERGPSLSLPGDALTAIIVVVQPDGMDGRISPADSAKPLCSGSSQSWR